MFSVITGPLIAPTALPALRKATHPHLKSLAQWMEREIGTDNRQAAFFKDFFQGFLGWCHSPSLKELGKLLQFWTHNIPQPCWESPRHRHHASLGEAMTCLAWWEISATLLPQEASRGTADPGPPDPHPWPYIHLSSAKLIWAPRMQWSIRLTKPLRVFVFRWRDR